MTHELPPLPYEYNALEPYIDEQTLRLHHDKHHLSYVTGLNNAEKKLAEARQKNDFALIKHWDKELAFHGAGHFLHSIYWENMAPKAKAGSGPKGDLLTALDRYFGGFDPFLAQFKATAAAVEGSGWALLVQNHATNQLEILMAEKHQNLSQWTTTPLLVCDVWEHAYYLKYQNNRPSYIDAFTNVINWDDVARRLK